MLGLLATNGNCSRAIYEEEGVPQIDVRAVILGLSDGATAALPDSPAVTERGCGLPGVDEAPPVVIERGCGNPNIRPLLQRQRNATARTVDDINNALRAICQMLDAGSEIAVQANLREAIDELNGILELIGESEDDRGVDLAPRRRDVVISDRGIGEPDSPAESYAEVIERGCPGSSPNETELIKQNGSLIHIIKNIAIALGKIKAKSSIGSGLPGDLDTSELLSKLREVRGKIGEPGEEDPTTEDPHGQTPGSESDPGDGDDVGESEPL
jgi:hypothetical protein